jgi:hypothetical protein
MEWKDIAQTLFELLALHLPKHGCEVISELHLKEARLQMKKRYDWAGKIVEIFCLSFNY